MTEVLIGRVGQIQAGKEQGNYVKIVDDSSNTGGFLILTSEQHDFSNFFDNWVGCKSDVDRYIQESNWDIKWDESKK